MKISYRTHPPLMNLKSRTFSGLRFSDKLPVTASQLDDLFIRHIQYFTKSIQVFSKPFGESALKAVSKPIEDGYFDNFVSKLDYSGTIVIAHYTIFIISKPYFRLYFMFAGDTLVAYMAKQENKESFWCDDSMIVGDGKKFTCEYWETVFLSLIFFLEYAEVEIKNVDANKKINTITCKYVNDTGLNLQFHDSKHFTTIVKSAAFNVRGHWRLQPCGEGLKDRKMIWISDFQKEGYTAPARKLST